LWAEPDQNTFDLILMDIMMPEKSGIYGIDITERELRLIQFFCQHPGEVLSRDTLFF